MKTILKFTAVLLIVAGGFACSEKENETKWIEAIAVDLGNPAVDGCGWAIKISNTVYIPDSLDEPYKQDGLKVMIIYENTSQTYQCPGFSDVVYDKIIIKQIKK